MRRLQERSVLLRELDRLCQFRIEAEKYKTDSLGDRANTWHSHWSYLHCKHIRILGGLFLIIGLIVPPVVGLFFAIFMIANVIMKKRKMNSAHFQV